MMDEQSERKRYYPEKENVPLSVAITEAVQRHDKSVSLATASELYDYVDPEAIDRLLNEPSDIRCAIRFQLPEYTISIWGDNELNIRVTERDDE